MKIRHVVIAAITLVTGTALGATTQHFASADVSSGDRPVLVPIETCRIADTRPTPNTVGPKASPLAAADTMTVDAQQADTSCTGKIPATATGLSLNVTALNAPSNSFITVWPDGTRPTGSSLNPAPGQRVFNAVTTQLSAGQTFQIFNNRGNVDVFVDVNGYYENHNHDDLYYTQDQIDTNFANKGDQYFAVVNSLDPGSITRSFPDVTLEHGGSGDAYFFTFPRDITTCYWNATLGGDNLLGNIVPIGFDLGITATQGIAGSEIDPDEVSVVVYNPGASAVVAGFTLMVTCP
jgi:hypothetical protein